MEFPAPGGITLPNNSGERLRDDHTKREQRRVERANRPRVEPLESRRLLAVNFTGDVIADFPADDPNVRVLGPFAEGTPFFTRPLLSETLEPLVGISGFELEGLRLAYDRVTDVLAIGFQQPLNPLLNDGTRVIAGDADNNGNGGTINPIILTLVDDPDNFIDFARLGGTETMGVKFDLNLDGQFEIIAGIPQRNSGDPDFVNKTPRVALNPGGTRQGFVFGQELPGFTGLASDFFIGETPQNPAFQFQIRNFTQLVTQVTGQAPVNELSFRIFGFAGSSNDGPISEAALPDQLVTFPLVDPARISGLVFVDNDGDLVLDPNSRLLPNVTLTLTGTNNLGQTITPIVTTTNAQGFYEFTNLLPGIYTVTQTQPPDLIDLGVVVGSLGGIGGVNVISNIVVASGDNGTRYDFVEIEPTGISGIVFVDVNENNVFDAGDQLLPNVTLTLTGTNVLDVPIQQVTTTNAQGFYQFTNLLPGTYTVTQTQPPGFLDGGVIVGNRGGTPGVNVISNIPLQANLPGINYDFFELLVRPGSISGLVFVDNDGDRILDPNSRLLPNVTVTLTGVTNTGQPITPIVTTTNAQGFYEFTNLEPGTYTVTQTQPPGLLDLGVNVGSLGGVPGVNVISNIVVGRGDAGTRYDFVEIEPTGISGIVFVDVNNNGLFDNGDQLLPNVTLTLTGADLFNRPVTQVTTTNAQGFYEFTNLLAGTYTVTQTQPPGFLDGGVIVGNRGGTPGVNVISNIPLQANLPGINYDFFELLPTPPQVPLRPPVFINHHDQHHINTFHRGLIRVNIFGGPDLDVRDIDPESVLLGGASPTWMLIHHVNRDGFLDLLLVYRSDEVDLPRGPQMVTVAGELYDGRTFATATRVYNQPIFHTNDLRVVPPQPIFLVRDVVAGRVNPVIGRQQPASASVVAEAQRRLDRVMSTPLRGQAATQQRANRSTLVVRTPVAVTAQPRVTPMTASPTWARAQEDPEARLRPATTPASSLVRPLSRPIVPRLLG